MGALACAALWAGAARAADSTELSPLPHDASQPAGVAVAADGNVWFTELDSGGTGRIGMIGADGKLTEFPLGDADSEPTAIAAGPDGNMWFTESGVDRIGQITPAGQIKEFGGLTAGAAPGDIATGPDGALWFTEGGFNRGNRIGRIDPASGAVQEFCIRGCSLTTAYSDAGLHPSQIVAGPDGRLWFTESNPDRGEGAADPYQDQGTGYIAAMTTSGTVTEYALPTFNAQPQGITLGPDGNLWFTETGPAGNRVGQITPGGQISEFGELPTPDSRPGRIVSPGDGHLWVAEGNGNRLAVLDTDGRGAELDPLPTEGAKPVGLAADPTGRLWITELRGNRLAYTPIELPDELKPPSPAAAAPAPPAAPDAVTQTAAARSGLAQIADTVVRGLRKRGARRFVKLGGLGVVLSAPAAGRVAVTLATATSGKGHKAARVVIARATAAFSAAGKIRSRLRLTRAGRRLLAHHRPVRARLTATFAPTRGRRVTVTRSVVLRP